MFSNSDRIKTALNRRRAPAAPGSQSGTRLVWPVGRVTATCAPLEKNRSVGQQDKIALAARRRSLLAASETPDRNGLMTAHQTRRAAQ
jgi:hypothetical protein